MRFQGFIGPSYQMRSINIDCQRSVNIFPEVDELGTGKEQEVAALVGTPGLTLEQTVGTSPCRGLYTAKSGLLYAVYGNTLYSIDENSIATTVGTLQTNVGPISMVDNTIDLFVVDGPNGYYTALGTTSLTQTTDPNWQGATQVILADGIFVFLIPASNQYYISNQLSTDINPIGFSSNNSLEKIVGIAWDHRTLWLFNQNSAEAYYDAGVGVGGTTGTPFQIIQGGFVEAGCASAFSVCQLANSLFWVGRDQNGWGQVFTANGYSPQRISTTPLEVAINSYGDISGTTSYAYQMEGHNFYCLNFPNAGTTWAFDASTGMWHERCYLNNGTYERHLGECHAFAYGKHFLGDYQSGKLYSMSSSVYSDNGNPIPRRRRSPHLSKDLNRLFHSMFQLDIEPGVGLDGISQGTDPKVMLRFSDDGGHTWSNEKWATLGKIGHTRARAIWRRLGHTRDRVYEVTVTDPVKTIFIDAQVEITEGAS